jgi:hypothetical protein
VKTGLIKKLLSYLAMAEGTVILADEITPADAPRLRPHRAAVSA